MSTSRTHQIRSNLPLLAGVCVCAVLVSYLLFTRVLRTNGSHLVAATAQESIAKVRNDTERPPRGKYSLVDVIGLLAARKGRPLYFGFRDLLVRVEYAPASEQLYLYALTDPGSAAKGPRELSLKEPLIKKVSSNFDADLIIVSCGREFGDDECDQYSPIRKVPRVGREIQASERDDYSTYLHAIGTILSSKPSTDIR